VTAAALDSAGQAEEAQRYRDSIRQFTSDCAVTVIVRTTHESRRIRVLGRRIATTLHPPGLVVERLTISYALCMTIEQLRAFYNAEPFQQFVMHLADGRSIPVRHREFIMAVPSGRTIVVCQPDDTLNVIDLPLVTDLEIQPNGRKSRKRRRE